MPATVDPRAGKLLPAASLIEPTALVRAYHACQPDVAVPAQRVSFGTSGHRGSAFDSAFNEAHVLAIAQAICIDRTARGIDGPLFVGIDTHALSGQALMTVIEVLIANGVTTMVDADGGYSPTPLISHAILGRDRSSTRGAAEGIVLTLSTIRPPTAASNMILHTEGLPTPRRRDRSSALPTTCWPEASRASTERGGSVNLHSRLSGVSA